MAGGAYVVGTCVAGGHAWQGGCALAGGMCGGVCAWGCAWQGACMVGGYVWHGGCVAGETATTVGSTHPTGMHSCFFTVVPAINRSYVPATTRKRLGISGIGEAWVKPV